MKKYRRIKQSPWLYLSVKLPMMGAFLMLVVIPALQLAVDFTIIPPKCHGFVTGALMAVLSYVGKLIYQPELHKGADDE